MPEYQPVSVPSLWTHLKWTLFRALEGAANTRAHLYSGAPRTHQGSALGSSGSPERWLWVFASTIGELNAIEPFLRAFLGRAGNLPLLLLSDHEHYRGAYLAKYPGAEFAYLDGGSNDAMRLVRVFPARTLIIAEIPCMPSDAPCRLSFAVVYELKCRRVPVFVINGWLYHHSPASRHDALEKRFFNRDYLRLIDAFLVQTDEIRRLLVLRGALPQQVAVIGNIKFDGVTRLAWSPDQAKDPALLRAIAASGRPCIVAGCVTNLDDQEGILDAFRMVLAALPQVLLVVAPRHPEVRERMEKLESFLRERGFGYVFRSRLHGAQFSRDTSVLVLDTIGELKDFYAVATLAYVGPNHNVLEPLAFDLPVFVMPGWEATYPSYPVYRLLLDNGAIIEMSEIGDLARAWTEFLNDPVRYQSQKIKINLLLTREMGATGRALDLVASMGLTPNA